MRAPLITSGVQAAGVDDRLGVAIGVIATPAQAGIGDLLPAGSVPPEVRGFLQQWLPSSLASYRDAVVFIVLILVLLVRPQGILGKRDQGDLE